MQRMSHQGGPSLVSLVISKKSSNRDRICRQAGANSQLLRTGWRDGLSTALSLSTAVTKHPLLPLWSAVNIPYFNPEIETTPVRRSIAVSGGSLLLQFLGSRLR